ncbi:gluconolactonase [Hyaloraphidium curvatum]|nr:gluconolactonase [Hyaloraphidium curvatum]
MSVPVFAAKTALTGLTFGEDPRWRNGKLFYSDFYSYSVRTYDPATGANEVVLQLPKDKEIPSGLGWLPDGTMLVVTLQGFKIIAVAKDGTVSDYADLKDIATWWPNDMVVSKNGTAYVGNFGFDLFASHEQGENGRPKNFKTGTLAIVHPGGRVERGPDDLYFANGCVITPDEKTFIIAESFANRVSAFDIKEDGSLTNRRVFAETPGTIPDGICLCEDGTVWVANPSGNELHRWAEGGKITGTIKTSQPSFAVTLGGPEMKTAFVITAPGSGDPTSTAGKIEVVETDVAGTGSP